MDILSQLEPAALFEGFGLDLYHVSLVTFG